MDGKFSCNLVDSHEVDSVYTGSVYVTEGARSLLLIASSRRISAPGVDLSFVPLPAGRPWVLEEPRGLIRVAAIFRGSVSE